VGIGPSALYRHFSGKQEILAKVLAAGLAPVHELVHALELTDPAAATTRLAACALDHRHTGLMWQREARDLSPDAFQSVRSTVHEIGRGLTGSVRTVRPDLPDSGADLLAWSMLSVLSSPSFHHLDLPRPAYEQLLAELVRTVLDTGLPNMSATTTPPAPVSAVPLTPASRREQLLTQATRMFAAQGYAQVGIEDIGNAVGIAGPSVYNHWPTKLDLLTSALQRGAAALAMDVATTYRQAANPADALRRLLHSYVELSHSHSDIFGLLITDIEHLPDEERHAIRRAQHEYVTEWTHLLRLHQPHLDPVTARIKVQAVLSVAHDTARIPHLHRNPAVPDAVGTIGTRLLNLPSTP
jgi:AcrR family transcriptional regulator